MDSTTLAFVNDILTGVYVLLTLILAGAAVWSIRVSSKQSREALVWGAQLEGATQSDLIITPYAEPTITVDNLKIAQFIYLLLNNAEIRDVIDTIAKKAVLILGRFTPERKAVLDALREAFAHTGTYLYCSILTNRAART